MIPYFFAAVHVNYSRKGEHVLHYREGIRNGIWSDMMIETSYMKFGPNGIIGKTTKPRALQI